MKLLTFLILPFFLISCAHSVHVYHSDNSQNFTGQLVESQSEQFVVLGFVQDTKYVEQAFDDLKQKCQSGRIEGINTRYSTSLGFFSWTNKIRMRGYCYKS